MMSYIYNFAIIYNKDTTNRLMLIINNKNNNMRSRKCGNNNVEWIARKNIGQKRILEFYMLYSIFVADSNNSLFNFNLYLKNTRFQTEMGI